jgi:hypothetical protein
MFHFSLGGEVENLKNMTRGIIRGLQRNDVLVDVHDCTIYLAAGSLHHVHFVCELHDADLMITLSVLVSD